MCFPPKIEMPNFNLLRPPSADSQQTNRRVQEATKIDPNTASVLTSPMGDPNFGKQINRTILTGVLA